MLEGKIIPRKSSSKKDGSKLRSRGEDRNNRSRMGNLQSKKKRPGNKKPDFRSPSEVPALNQLTKQRHTPESKVKQQRDWTSDFNTADLNAGDLNADLIDIANLVRNIDAAMIVVDRELRICWLTPKAQEIFSLTPEGIGRSLIKL